MALTTEAVVVNSNADRVCVVKSADTVRDLKSTAKLTTATAHIAKRS